MIPRSPSCLSSKTWAIGVKTIPQKNVAQEAEVVLVGPRTLDVPLGRSVHGGSCEVRANASVYGVAPHMHFTGIHARATLVQAASDGAEIVLHDADFDPYESRYYDFEPLLISKGDRLNVECTFDNETDKALACGDSALQEMCFMNFGVYPSLPYGNAPCDW